MVRNHSAMVIVQLSTVNSECCDCAGPYSYQILIDGEEKKSGSLFEDFSPPFNPPKEIDDPEDTKPEDWVDTPK